jgi:Hypervirulence associated proteins TUDOR domain
VPLFPSVSAGYVPPMSDPEKTFHHGDDVVWRSHGQQVHGTVEREITERTQAAGRTVDASPDEPQYEVKSDRTGREAVHKPGALHRD